MKEKRRKEKKATYFTGGMDWNIVEPFGLRN